MRTRAGFVLIYGMIAMTAFFAFCMLAVDYGRVQLVKTELLATSEAAARAAVTGLSDGTMAEKAVWVASQNRANGQPVTLTTSGADADVAWGRWDSSTNTFTVASTPANAVRVIARRTAARGTAVQLSFGSMLGIPAQNITCTSIAMFVPAIEKYGVIGLDYITMKGNASMAYWSASGSTDPTNGHIASNGNITLEGSTYIYGNARPGPGRVVYGAAGRVAGSTAQLSASLSYPAASPTTYATSNNNASISSAYFDSRDLKVDGSAICSLAGGVYYIEDLEIASGATLNFTGPATVYCYKGVRIAGRVNTASSLPANLKLILGPDTSGDPPDSLSIGSNSAIYASVYAPQSMVTLSGTGAFYGSILGKSVTMTGTSAIYYDMNLEPLTIFPTRQPEADDRAAKSQPGLMH